MMHSFTNNFTDNDNQWRDNLKGLIGVGKIIGALGVGLCFSSLAIKIFEPILLEDRWNIVIMLCIPTIGIGFFSLFAEDFLRKYEAERDRPAPAAITP